LLKGHMNIQSEIELTVLLYVSYSYFLIIVEILSFNDG
jgi:hypothetical protein